MEEKICTKCKAPKPLVDFFKDKSKKDGLRPICKACTKNQQDKQRRSPEGKEKIKKHNSQYREKNKEEINRKQRARLRECREETNAKNRERYKYDDEYREKVKKRNRASHYKSKDANNAKSRERHWADRENRNAASRNYYISNREEQLRKSSVLQKRKVASLDRGYVIKQLCRTLGLVKSEITPELIELKREQVLLHRAIKETKDGIT